MYFDRIKGVVVFDILDYFLLSALLGSLIASHLKKKKNSSSDEETKTNSEKIKMERGSNLALESRGGQLEVIQVNTKRFMLAQKIKGLVEKLSSFIREKELKGGLARFFFKNLRLLIEIILSKSQIHISYALLDAGVNAPVIIVTSTVGGITGFTIAWFTAGISLFAPPGIILILLLKSVTQQIISRRNYLRLKNIVTEDGELKEKFRAFFIEGESRLSTGIEMKPQDLKKNLLPELNFDSDQNFDEFIRSRMHEELGLIENPTPEQLNDIISNRKIRKKGKTVYFKDFIKKITEDSDNIVEAEIIKKVKKLKVENK